MDIFKTYLGNRIKRIYFVGWIQSAKELKVLADLGSEYWLSGGAIY